MGKAVHIFAALAAVLLIVFCTRHYVSDAKEYAYNMEEFEYSENSVQSPETILRKGNYVMHVSYSAEEDIAYTAEAGNSYTSSGMLAGGSGMRFDIPVCLTSDTASFYLKFRIPYSDALMLHNVTIESKRALYTDDIYFCILCVAAVAAVIVFNRKRACFLPEQKQAFGILCIGFFAACIMDYEPVLRFGTDIRVHLTRIEGIKDGLAEGQFPVILFPESFHGHGEIGCLYPSVFLYFPALLRLSGVSLLACYKTMQFLITAATLFTTYMATRYICSDQKACAVTSLLYTLFPYRLYVMGASSSSLGRGISMIFFPLVMAGLYLIFEEGRKWYVLSAGMAGILWSHVMNFVIAVLFILVVCCFRIHRLDKKKFQMLVKAAMAVIPVSLGVLVPFLAYYFEGLNLDYLKFDIFDKLFSSGEFWISSWNLMAFFYIGCAFIVYMRNRLWRNGKSGYFFCIAVIFSIFWMSTTSFPWKTILKIPGAQSVLSTFQNLKRLYVIEGYLIALVTGFVIMETYKGSRKQKIWAAVLISAALIGTFPSFRDYFQCGKLMDRVTGYTDHEQMEYLPAGTEADDYRSNAVFLSDEENIKGQNYSKKGSHVNFDYTCMVDEAYVELPVFYYSGYKAFHENGEPYRIEKGDRNHIRIYLEKSGVPRYVHLAFDVHWIFTLSAAASAAFCIGAVCMISMKQGAVH